jgi:hypothetical protein
MGFFDKLLGHEEAPAQRPAASAGYETLGGLVDSQSTAPGQGTDEHALARYRYMLQTAPPEAVEQAHQEAFVKLTLEQRRMALEQLAQASPDTERGHLNDDPRTLARAATRAELRQPGTLERTFSGAGVPAGMGGGMAVGGLLAGSLLTSIAGGFIGSAIAQSFFADPANAQAADNELDGAQTVDAGADTGGFGDTGDFGDCGSDLGGDFSL